MAENDDAWQRFFAQTDTLQQIAQVGHCIITADALKRYGQREPRLMAKIDTLAERPRPFKEHHVALFPVRNGVYVLFRDPEAKSYYRFGDALETLPIQRFVTPADLFAYDAFPGPQRLNESQAIDFAHLATLLQHFVEDDKLTLVIRGRTYTNPFSFYLPQNNLTQEQQAIDVVSVQIEIDAGYESPTGIYLIEAKVGRRDDFNIRQLYYPYLEWRTRSHKRVVPIFLAYTNGKYYLTEFAFTPRFGELEVRKAACFVINEQPRPPLALGRLLAELPPASTLQEPAVPFPQADDLDKVLDVVAKVEAGLNSKQELADAFEFDGRQGDYYANAACYVGLVQRTERGFALTTAGANYLHTRSRALRNELVVRQLLLRPTYRAIFAQLQATGFALEALSPAQIAATIAEHTTLSGSTVGRRGKTVRSWLATLLRNAEFQP